MSIPPQEVTNMKNDMSTEYIKIVVERVRQKQTFEPLSTIEMAAMAAIGFKAVQLKWNRDSELYAALNKDDYARAVNDSLLDSDKMISLCKRMLADEGPYIEVKNEIPYPSTKDVYRYYDILLMKETV